MAPPSAVETITVPVSVDSLRLHSTTAATADYKQLAPTGFSREGEEIGTEEFSAAKVG